MDYSRPAPVRVNTREVWRQEHLQPSVETMLEELYAAATAMLYMGKIEVKEKSEPTFSANGQQNAGRSPETFDRPSCSSSIAHLDLAWNASTGTAICGCPCEQIRQIETDAGIPTRDAAATPSRSPTCAAARSSSFIATLLAAPAAHRRHAGHPALCLDGRRPTARRTASSPTTAAWSRKGTCAGIKDWPHARRPCQGMARRTKTRQTLPLGFILSMEGADPILRPDQVEEWYQRRPAHRRPGPLRRQPLRPRHGHRGRPVPAGPGRSCRRWSASA